MFRYESDANQSECNTTHTQKIYTRINALSSKPRQRI